MRDIARIMPFCIKLATLWLKHPDLRFMQLVDLIRSRNVQGNRDDAFYMEDDDIEKIIDKMTEE